MALATLPRTQRRLFRIPQAVEYLNGAVTAATLRQWIWLRKIEHVRLGRAVAIPQAALDRLVDANTVQAISKVQ